MGLNEIRALMAKRTGLAPEEGSYVPVKPSGPKERKPLNRGHSRKKKANDDLEKWFASIAAEYGKMECRCWECNASIPDPFIRHATAHIFPKNDFPSVATHPLNYLILGAGCCHDKSHRMDKFSAMAIWSEAVDRFLVFQPLLSKEEISLKYYTLFLGAAHASFPERVAHLITLQTDINA